MNLVISMSVWTQSFLVRFICFKNYNLIILLSYCIKWAHNTAYLIKAAIKPKFSI